MSKFLVPRYLLRLESRVYARKGQVGINRHTIYHLTGQLFVETEAFLTVKRTLSSTNFVCCSHVMRINIIVVPILLVFSLSSRQMAGDEVPVQWRGGMNTTYRFGGSFKTAGWYSVYHVPNSKAVIGHCFWLVCLFVKESWA